VRALRLEQREEEQRAEDSSCKEHADDAQHRGSSEMKEQRYQYSYRMTEFFTNYIKKGVAKCRRDPVG
jgi:hypothetical protein